MRVLLKIYVTHLIVTPTSKSRSAAEMIVLMAQTKKHTHCRHKKFYAIL